MPILLQRYGTSASPPLDHFQEAVAHRTRCYRASALRSVWNEPDDMAKAIERAMQICNRGGLSLREHFKAIYVANAQAHSVERDWQLSKLAYCLTVLNGNPDHPLTGRMQLAMLQRHLNEPTINTMVHEEVY